MKSNLSICIPRVDNSISRQTIFDYIRAMRVGFIDRIIEIPLKNDQTGKQVIIKFKTWVNNETSEKIMKRFDETKNIKIVYNYPWYWVAYTLI